MVLEVEDYMDDGLIIYFKFIIDGRKGEVSFDFEGISFEVFLNWNVLEVVMVVVIIYCLCCFVDVDIFFN